MVVKWPRAFCTSVPKDAKENNNSQSQSTSTTPRLGSRIVGFFSNPSTPRVQSNVPASTPTLRCKSVDTFPAVNLVSMPSNSAPQSPKLRCKTKESPSFFRRSSAASSPRSPSAFSLLNLGIGTSKNRCGVCLQKVKSGQGTAIFTAECGHSFHFPCIASRMKKEGALTCPICNSTWKEMHISSSDESNHGGNRGDSVSRDFNAKNDARYMLKVYNDDEPLSSPTFGARFNPILESDELEEGNDEFPGFFVSGDLTPVETKRRNLEISFSEAALISAGKSGETYAVVLRIKAPTAPVRRAPIDLVTVLNVGRNINAEKIQLMKKAMKLIVSSLSTTDRLSIVAFSTASKRLLSLRRMNTAGKRSARRIIDAVVALDTAATCATDSIKKAAKVLSDRREKNPSSAIILLSDGQFSAPFVSSTAFSAIPLHSINLNAPLEIDFFKSISGLLMVQDLSIHLGFPSTASPANISAVYSCKNKPSLLGSSSGWCRIGDFHSDEEREFLIELRSKTSLQGPQRRMLSIRYTYKDPSTQQSVSDNEQSPLPIPHPRAAGTSSTRLRCQFLTTRAVAESTRLVERNDVVGARRMLASARALVRQTGSGEEFVRVLEAEMVALEVRENSGHDRRRGTGHVEEKGEALTPTSAWRAAERLAKVAIMRKSLNRVSDLHGFENARF